MNSQPPYLYNRCHLIAYALTGENANERNLITGTRYFNTTAMLPFEEQVMRYLDQSENHVLYRVTPYFKGDELVARGVEMEAYSVEDGREMRNLFESAYANQANRLAARATITDDELNEITVEDFSVGIEA